MPIQQNANRAGNYGLIIISLTIIIISACSQSNINVASPTPPGATVVPEGPYQFNLQSEVGDGIVQAADWAPDGSTFALATSRQVDVYDADTLERVTTLNTGQSNEEIVYSPDSKYLAVGEDDGTIQVWDLGSKQLLHTLLTGGFKPVYGDEVSLAFSRDGQKLVSAMFQTVYIWDLSNGTLLKSFPGHAEEILSIDISPDGNTILAAGGRQVFVRDLSSGELVYPPIEVLDAISSIFFAMDGKQFFTVHSSYGLAQNDLSTTYDSTVKTWDVITGKKLADHRVGKDRIDDADIESGQHISILGGEEKIYLWDTSKQEEVDSIPSKTGRLESIAISPDGSRFLSVASDTWDGSGLIQLWDLTSKQVEKTFDGYSSKPVDVAFSQDGKRAAIAGLNRNTRIIDLDSGQVLHILKGGMPVAFSPDGKTLMYTETPDRLILSDVGSGERLDTPPIQCPSVSVAAFHPDGKSFVLGGESCDLQLRDARTGKLIKNLRNVPGNEHMVFDEIVFSPDGKKLLLVGYRFRLLDTESGETLWEEEPNLGRQLAAFSPDGRYLALVGFGDSTGTETIQIREVESNQIVLTLQTLQESIDQMIFGPDGHSLFVSGESLEVWDLWEEQPLANAKLADAAPFGVSLTKDGQNLYFVDSGGTLQHWSFQPSPQLMAGSQPTPTYVPTPTVTPDIPKVELVQVAEIGKGIGSKVYYSPDGRIAIFLQDGALRWFDTRSQKELGSIDGIADFGEIIISPNNKFAVVNSYNGQVVDLVNSQEIGQLGGGNGAPFGFTFSKNSQYIAYVVGDRTTGGPYHSIGLWNTDKKDWAFSGWDTFPTLLPERYHVMSPPIISPDESLIAAGHSDKRVYVWDMLTGETRFTLEGHGANVTNVDFSPNGRLLASGSEDGTIRLWDTSTGKLVQVLTGFMDDIWEIRFAPNGQSLWVLLANEQDYMVDLSSGKITLQPETKNAPTHFELQQYKEGFSTGESSIFSEVLFSPDGKTLATASQNVLLWDVESGGLLAFLGNPSGGVLRGMEFNADGSLLAATTSEDLVLVWDTKTGESLLSLKSSFLSGASVFYGVGDSQWGPARSSSAVAEQGLAFSPKGSLLAFGNGSRIEVWDVEASKKISEMAALDGEYATRLSFSADGKRLYAILNRNRSARVWNVDTAEMIGQIDLPDVDPNAFSAVALNGSKFARNNNDDTGNAWIELWDLDGKTYKILQTITSSNEPLVFSPDGNFLAAAGNEGLSIWNSATGQRIYQTELDYLSGGMSISRDNQLLAVGNSGSAALFDIAPIVKRTDQPNYQVPIPQSTPTPKILEWPTPTAVPTSMNPMHAASSRKTLSPENAPLVVETNHFGRGVVEQISLSPDNNSILLSSSLGPAEYYIDWQTGKLVQRVKNDINGWTFNTVKVPDGRILSTSVEDGRVKVRDVNSGSTLLDMEGGGEPAISPDGTMVVYLDPDGVLEVWDIASKQLVTKLANYSRFSVNPVFSPDGNWIAAIQSGTYLNRYADSIRLWNARTGEIVNALAGPDYDITDLSFNVDGKFLVGAAGGSAWIWDVRPGVDPEKLELYPVELKDNLNIYTNTITSAALSPDNQTLAVGTSENTLKLFDRASQKEIKEFRGHTGSIIHLRFSPDGTSLLSADQDGRLMLWDLKAGKELASLEEYNSPVGGLSLLQDGNLAAWGEGATWTLDPATMQVLHTTRINGPGSILAASPAGDVLAVYEPYQVSLWDAQSGELLDNLEGEAEDPYVEYYWEGLAFRKFYDAAFSQDGSRLATAGAGGVWYYDLKNRELLQQYPGSNAQKVSLSPDGQSMLTSLYDQANPIALYDVQSGNVLFHLDEGGQGSDYAQSVFSPDGRWVGTVKRSWDGPYELKIYDTLARSKQEYKSMTLGQEIPLTSLAFNSSNTLVAVGKANGEILLIDLSEMKLLCTLTGHRGAVEHLLFTPDGYALISGGVDGTVRTWTVR